MMRSLVVGGATALAISPRARAIARRALVQGVAGALDAMDALAAQARAAAEEAAVASAERTAAQGGPGAATQYPNARVEGTWPPGPAPTGQP